ncbi:hypothetical protein DFH07DRAFT_909280 [Mycena maculata]|uniref:Protein kinase domain-containing protein n=1 Tax=Mycena maculata TaxID=230809 RepID=A0AAD7KBT4_9AGAR|nr:hypothetical protein DFH07DRAFT_909280 [Mycena maculata]
MGTVPTSDQRHPHFEPDEPGSLTINDIYWRDLAPWLEECGYMLRPRFRPGWIPSWKLKGTGGPVMVHEDAQGSLRHQIIDAVRMRDGLVVVLKRIQKDDHPHEVAIHSFLTSEPLASDPKNHCVPLLEVLEPPSLPGTQLLVMKLLRMYEDPHFDTVGEAVDYFRQIFEGVQFMHKHLVAHRDCGSGNIMMDGQHLYPNGFHPTFQWLNMDHSARAKHTTRTRAPPKYYLIDFGISVRFSPDSLPRTEVPIKGADRTVPEFEGDGCLDPLDPFATDVYYLGNMIREDFLDGQYEEDRPDHEGLEGFEFMRPLVNDMVKRNPEERPKIDEVVERFEKIVSRLSTWKLRSRVQGKMHYTLLSIPSIVRHWRRRISFMIKGVPPIPSYREIN